MDHDPVLVFNPRRRRRSRRKMSALQRRYFGGGRRRFRRLARRRNEPDPNPRRRRSVRRHLSLRRRRNPATLRGFAAPIMEVVKEGVTGTLGVQVNNLIGNSLASQVFKVVGRKRQMVKVATAVLIPGLLGSVFPQFRRFLRAAGSHALSVEGSKALNRLVYPAIGDVGQLLSTSDGEAAVQTPQQQTLQYNSVIEYLPGGTYAERPSPRLGAYIYPRQAVGQGKGSADQSGIYDASPGVY